MLVGAGRDWSRAVQSAAKAIGFDTLDTVASGREAIGRLVRAEHPYSHVLLRAGASDGLLEDLHGLTSGEAGSRTALTLLGSRVARRAARLPRVARPNAKSLSAALRRSEPRNLAGHWDKRAIDLPEALAWSMVEVRYQPVARIADGACVGVEALARLNHPAHGLLPPIRFVPQLEDAGLADGLARAVASRAFAELVRPALARHDLVVSLNVTLDVLLDPQKMARLEARREAVGLARKRIVFELTESRPASDVPALGRTVERLRADGYGVAIDDLGPAVANHAALLELPFSAVKLDIGVVRAMRDAEGAAFLTDALEAAHRTGARVVAEGVEDPATLRRLAGLGVDLVQGFLVSRPLPAAALPIWLETWPDRRAQRLGRLRGTPDQTSR